MKYITSIILSLFTTGLLAQETKNESNNDLSPFFIALVVEDVNTVANWYKDNLGFEIFKEDEYPEYGVIAKFLKIDGFQIEMFQHKDAYSSRDFVPEEKPSFLMHGISKFGFQVENATEWLAKMKSNDVEIYRDLYEDTKFGYKYFFIKDPGGNTIQIFEKLK